MGVFHLPPYYPGGIVSRKSGNSLIVNLSDFTPLLGPVVLLPWSWRLVLCLRIIISPFLLEPLYSASGRGQEGRRRSASSWKWRKEAHKQRPEIFWAEISGVVVSCCSPYRPILVSRKATRILFEQPLSSYFQVSSVNPVGETFGFFETQ